MKNIGILSENFQFLVMKFPLYLNRRVFVMSYRHIAVNSIIQIVKERFVFHKLCSYLAVAFKECLWGLAGFR